MDVSSSAGPNRAHATSRSIRFTFFVRVAWPAGALVLAWGLAVGIAVESGSARREFSAHNHRTLVELAVLAGVGLVVVVLAALLLVASFARRLSRDISALAAAAQYLADEQLPQLVERSRGGAHAAQATGSEPRPRAKTTEVALAAAAIASLQRTAVAAAVGEVGLRNGLRQIFISLARRNQSLLHRQLRLIDALEQKASDPAALADLFALDHLTTRMRRQADSLTILSGAVPGRSWSEPVPVIDVIRGAMAEVEDYKRVSVLTRTEDAVAGPAVADMIHLLAELIENATLFSPSGTLVEVRAERVANGFAIEIDDRGLGIDLDRLTEINQQLASPPDVDLANADQLGLFVGGKLAARHGVRVSLRTSAYGGVSAIVLMPDGVIVSAPQLQAGQQPDARLAISGSDELNLRSAAVVTLVGRHSAQPRVAAADHRRGVFDSRGRRGLAADVPGSDDLSRGVPGPDDVGRVVLRPEDLSRGGPGPDDLNRGVPGPDDPGRVVLGPDDRSPDVLGSDGLGSDGLALGGDVSVGLGSDVFAPGGVAPAGPGSDGLASVGQLNAGARRSLPRRTRQASLSPHLRDSPPPPPPPARPWASDPIPPSVGSRTPEHARDLAASLQSGWQRGRQSDEPDPQPGVRAPSADRPDLEAPHGEEA